jgi:hypothetical protein
MAGYIGDDPAKVARRVTGNSFKEQQAQILARRANLAKMTDEQKAKIQATVEKAKAEKKKKK